jgi:hypothetical protein
VIDETLRGLERRLRASREVPPFREAHHVLLASYPKSGNTWLRFILANLSKSLGGHETPVDFHGIGRYVPEIRRNRSLEGRIETAGFPLFLKTHFPYIPAFGHYRSLVVIRDPADTLVSYYRHLSGAAGKRLPDLPVFAHHWRYGCGAWGEWYEGWVDRADHVIRYEGLLQDPAAEIGAALDALGVELPGDLIDVAVERSSKDRMKSAQRERGDPNLRNPDYQFVGKARTGWSRELLDEEQLRQLYRCAGRVAERFGYGRQQGDDAEGSGR